MPCVNFKQRNMYYLKKNKYLKMNKIMININFENYVRTSVLMKKLENVKLKLKHLRHKWGLILKNKAF